MNTVPPVTEGFYVSAWKNTHIDARKFIVALTPADARRKFCEENPQYRDLLITVEGSWK